MSTQLFTLTTTSPAAAGTAIGSVLPGLREYDWFMIDAKLTQATGGVLDVYLQRKLVTDVWHDWLHFPQLAAGSTVFHYSMTAQSNTGLTVVGAGTDATPAPALAANTMIGGHPGDIIRVVYVAGASTSAGASQSIWITARTLTGD